MDDFGTQAVGTQAAERVVLIRNLQPRADIAIGTVVSSVPLVFPVQHQCPLSLPPLAQCRVRTWFRQQVAGPAQARFDIEGANGQVLRSGRLLGTDVDQQQARLVWSPATSLIDFGRVAVGASEQRTLQLHNPSGQAVLLQRLRITGPQALRFGLGADCAAAGRLEPGARCDVTITHAPRAAERAEGWVELITSDASNAPLLRVQAIGVAVASIDPPPSAAEPAPQQAGQGGGSLSWIWLSALLAATLVLRAVRLRR